MLTGEQKIRRGFHWVAVILAALLLACGLVLITFDVRDLWHPAAEDIPPPSISDLFLGVLGLLIACVTLWAAVRGVGWIVVRLYRRCETNNNRIERGDAVWLGALRRRNQH